MNKNFELPVYYHNPSKGEVYWAQPGGKGIVRVDYLNGQVQTLKGDEGPITYHDLWCHDCNGRDGVKPISKAEYHSYYEIMVEKREEAHQAYLAKTR